MTETIHTTKEPKITKEMISDSVWVSVNTTIPHAVIKAAEIAFSKIYDKPKAKK